MQITGLTYYPVKSMAGTEVDSAVVTPQGLDHDRRWVTLDPAGNRVSARECHGLLAITPTVTPTGLRLTARCGDSIDVRTPGPEAPLTTTRMSRIDELTEASPDAGQWLTRQLGRPLRLAYHHDLDARPIGEEHGGRPGETMSLADAGPILLISMSSVRQLCDWVAEAQQAHWLTPEEAARRFRANVVIDGPVAPFAEDAWGHVTVGDVRYRRGELCDRCVLTTIDPDLLTTSREPIRTLARHRAWAGATWFGVRLVPATRGGISVGDPVLVTD